MPVTKSSIYAYATAISGLGHAIPIAPACPICPCIRDRCAHERGTEVVRALVLPLERFRQRHEKEIDAGRASAKSRFL
jgi:hypothetical protein